MVAGLETPQSAVFVPFLVAGVLDVSKVFRDNARRRNILSGLGIESARG
jgi:hypothetical protein